MKQTAILILVSILLLVVLAACDGAAQVTPTPFPATWTPGPALAAQQSFQMEIADLLAEPETYEGAYVQVTGRYRRRPLLICESESATNPSPATWDLLDDSNLALAAGEFDDALRSLVPDGLTMTVAGYWQLWEGQVGCGKQAEKQTIWFLEVTDIVSPSPIVQVTLTPNPQGETPLFSDEMVTPGSGQEPGPGPGSVDPPTPTAEGGFPVTPAETPLPADATATAMFATSPAGENPPTPTTNGTNDGQQATATTSGNVQSTSTPIATSSGSGSATVTPRTSATSAPGPGTPTVTSAPIGQVTSTPSSGSGNVVDVDIIRESELGSEYLSVNEIHAWELMLSDSTVITVSLAAEPQLNLGLEILDQNGGIVSQSKQAGASQMETIKLLAVDPNKEYTIRVFNQVSTGEGYYMLSVWGNAEGTIFDARGILSYGQSGNATIPAEDDINYPIHMWFFYGEQDDVITIETSTVGDHFMLISLYDSDGNPVEDVDYVQEIAEDISLPMTGMYVISLEEIAFDMTTYTITLRQ